MTTPSMPPMVDGGGPRHGRKPSRSGPRVVLGVVAAVVVVALVGLGVWWAGIGRSGPSKAATTPSTATSSSGPSTTATGAAASGATLTPTRSLALGDCAVAELQASESLASVTGVEVVPCSDPHDIEVYHSEYLADLTDYPGGQTLQPQVEATCLTAFQPFVGKAYENSDINVYYYFPSEQSWNQKGDRRVTCVVTAGSGTTGSLRDAGH